MRTGTAIRLIFFALVLGFLLLRFVIAKTRETGHLQEGDRLRQQGRWREAVEAYKRAVEIGIGGRTGQEAFDRLVAVLKAQGHEVKELPAAYQRFANRANMTMKPQKSGWQQAKSWLFPMTSTADDIRDINAAQRRIKEAFVEFWSSLPIEGAKTASTQQVKAHAGDTTVSGVGIVPDGVKPDEPAPRCNICGQRVFLSKFTLHTEYHNTGKTS
jgi:hypothetical protein